MVMKIALAYILGRGQKHHTRVFPRSVYGRQVILVPPFVRICVYIRVHACNACVSRAVKGGYSSSSRSVRFSRSFFFFFFFGVKVNVSVRHNSWDDDDERDNNEMITLYDDDGVDDDDAEVG